MNANAHRAPVTFLTGVGPISAQRLVKLNIRTIADLLCHVPLRYEDLRHLSAIAALRDGERTTIQGTIRSIASRRTPRKRMVLTEAVVNDDSGALSVVWFHKPYLDRTLPKGTRVVLSGRVARSYGKLQMIAPAYEKIGAELLHVGRLVPMYPLTHGISQRQMRFWTATALRSGYELDDPLPEPVRLEERLLPLTAAVQRVHFPSDEQERDRALKRLKFDELLHFHLRRIMGKRKESADRAPSIPFVADATKRFVRSLPFELTAGQRAAAWDIVRDMTGEVPMRRLLQGDVGSGKTVVAAIAVEAALRSKTQVAFMAPSQILAEQHARTFAALFDGRRVNIFLRTQGLKKRADRGRLHDVPAREMDALAASGSPLCVIGTQALLQKALDLPALAFVCVDEQHRFGVAQRQLLHHKREDGMVPHLLSMTATPIPRTLALSLAADLAISTLKELPRGRKSVATTVLGPEQRMQAYAAVERACKAGQQAFVVAPLIDPSDRIGVASATELFEELRGGFAGLAVGLLHGGMPSKQQERVLHAFADNTLQILIATPVIEVGIDIPNATMMVIEGAERFGLAQLHQLRGRVGRGEEASTCFLVSQSDSSLAWRRLSAVARTQDGFALAKLDLELRGSGDLAGTEQSGFLGFRFADLGDTGLIERSRAVAEQLLSQDPDLHMLPLLQQSVTSSPPPHQE
ncbi:MAG: ATP-dependent DNA helicase RecG [Candidatus Kerfeldbacteria bacterium]|nr:ATP-dependent DNA helicase RecG [Candidatus Kerfeldbacteria bacterium]